MIFEEYMLYYLESEFTRQSKLEIEAELNSARKWISEDLELDYSRTRLGRYIDYLQGKEKLDSLDDFRQYILVAREVHDLLRVFRAFIGSVDPEVKSKIETALSGQHFRYQAAKEELDRSRDYLHELSIASRFKDNGLSVDIQENCDVIARYEKYTVFIECKRIKSEIQLFKRFKKAEKQLKDRIGSSQKNKIGFIALDITDLVIIDDVLHEYASVNQLREYFYNKLKVYVAQHKSKIKSYVGRATKSVLFSVNGFGYVKGKGVVNATTFYAVGCESNPKDFKNNDNILKKVV